MAQNLPNLSVDDAVSYLDMVKKEFETQPDKYDEFVAIMSDFRLAKNDTSRTIERVTKLFAGNVQLIEGFNTFLPSGYHIAAVPNQPFIDITTPQGKVRSRL